MGDFSSSPALSSGKLPSVKRRSLLETIVNAMPLRRLQGARQTRPDPYAVPEDSPQKPSIILGKPEEPLGEVSPLRVDKRRQANGRTAAKPTSSSAKNQLEERRKSRQQQFVPEVGEDEQNQPKTPRRSTRKSSTGERLVALSPSGKRVVSAAQSPVLQEIEDDEGVERNVEGVEDGVEGVENDLEAEDDGLFVHEADEVPGGEDEEAQAETEPHSQPPASAQRRGRGRPRKSKPEEGTTRSTSKTKRTPGRPRKSNLENRQSSRSRSSMAQKAEGATCGSASKQTATSAAGVEQNPERLPKPATVRVSQVHFPDAEGQDIFEEDDDDGPSATQPRKKPLRKEKRKRTADESITRQAKKAKAARQPDPVAEAGPSLPDSTRAEGEELDENGQNDEAEKNLDGRRIFGQGPRLEQIFAACRKYESSQGSGVSREDTDVLAIIKLCRKAERSLSRLGEDEETDESLSDPPQEFDEIQQRVRGLCGRNDEFPTNMESRAKASEIYAKLIPRLIKLLENTVNIYEAIDGVDNGVNATASVSDTHLKNIIALIDIILEMGNGATKYKRPDPKLAVVRVVKNELLLPLGAVRNELHLHLLRKEQAQAMARHRALLEAEAARQSRQEEEEQMQRERETRLRKLWFNLHDERRYIAGFVPWKQAKHLRIPDAPIEIDHNGEPFERLEVFRPRIGPSPAHVAKAKEDVWSLKEIDALQRGLEEYAGDRVFQDIFREHCGRKGALNRFNVTEIVTIAADLKEHLQEEQMESQGFVEEWVKQIPVWTNFQTLLGQENSAD